MFSKCSRLSAKLAALEVPVLEVIDLQVERNGQRLLSDLSFSVQSGGLVVVSGGNGVGKSSLLASLVGLLPVASGNIQCPGPEGLFYLSHKRGLRRDLTVLENLQQDLRYLFNPQRAETALTACGLTGLENRLLRGLSAGQQQRVALAKLWLTDAKLWVLDEPLEALDVAMRAVVEEKLQQHVVNQGAVVVATHIPLQQSELVTRTITLGEQDAI